MILTTLAVSWPLLVANGSLGAALGIGGAYPPADIRSADQLPENAVRRIRVRVAKRRGETDAGVLAVAWSPNGKMIACRCSDNTARLFSLPDGNEGFQLRLDSPEDSGWDNSLWGIRTIRFSPDSRIVAITWAQGDDAKLWETASGRELGTLLGGGHFAHCVDFSPDGRMLAVACRNGIRLWDAESKQLIKTLDEQAKTKSPGSVENRCLFTPDGRSVITASNYHEIRFWDWRSGDQVGQIISKGRPVRCLSISADGQLLAVCHNQNGNGPSQVSLWELSSQKFVREFVGTRGYSDGIALSPDGYLLAASDERDNKVTLWNLYTGKELVQYEGHTKSVYEVAFSPDSRTLVSASKDCTLIFWKVPEVEASGKPIEPVKLAQLWDTLLGDDAKAAYQAIWDLRQTGDQATGLIKTHVKPVAKVEPEKVQKLVADLDDPAFETRKRAATELTELGQLAEPALRKALEGEPSAEVRKQAQGLLSKLRFPIYQGETLRALRAVQVLERIGTPKAREVLGELAQGADGANLTRDAKAALDRLNRRAAGK